MSDTTPRVPTPTAPPTPVGDDGDELRVVRVDDGDASGEAVTGHDGVDDGDGDLRGRAARGAAWSFAERWVGRLSTTIVVVLLGRLLVPGDFGVVAVAAVAVNVLSTVAELGFGQAIVRHPDLRDEHVDTAFWGSVGFGVALAVLVVAGAGWIADVLDAPESAPMMRVLSLTCVLTALSNIQRSLLQRSFEFKTIATRRFVATIAASVLAVAMAIGGFGAWALVGQLLLQSTLTAVLLWRVGDYWPRWRFRPSAFRELVSFGSAVTAMNLLSVLGKNIDNAIIAATLGSTALGHYVIAYRVNRLIIEATLASISPVALSGFAKLQHDLAAVRNALLDLTKLSSTVAVPIFVGISAITPTLIPTLFGPGWQPAVLPARLLALTGIVFSVAYFDRSVLMALGRSRTALMLAVVQTVTNVVGFVVGANFGIVGVAAGLLVSMFLVWPYRLWVLRRVLDLQPLTYLRNLSTAVAGGVLIAVTVVPAEASLLVDLPGLARLPLLAAIGATAYLGFMAVASPDTMRQLLGLVAGLRRRSTGART